MWGEEYSVGIENSSSWVSRSGISVWNLQSPSYNFFIYPLISVSAHERPLRKRYFQWIMLNCLAEALPRWSSLLQNIALSALLFSRACPLPLQFPLLWLRLCCSPDAWALTSTTPDETIALLLFSSLVSANKPSTIYCFIPHWPWCRLTLTATTAALFHLLRIKATSQLVSTLFLSSSKLTQSPWSQRISSGYKK